eukprot:TRINITY_DN72585_c0_g1_i1.p1 TRINITY_DN72585_c0_g1~~TRINITY_DN72585_c0_g1_i1.p1  ORF type:complete len:541 (+),score=158.36 TRINITY_DN72585_c0_g1_i1:161-1783(+)
MAVESGDGVTGGGEAAPAAAATTAEAQAADGAAAADAPPEETPVEKAHKAWAELADVEIERLAAGLEGLEMEAQASSIREWQKPLRELDINAGTSAAILEEAFQAFTAAGGLCRLVEKDELRKAAERLCGELEALPERFARAKEAIQQAEDAAYAAMVAKRKAAKAKEKEKDPLDCKFWISWDSMYRRVKMGKWIGLTCSADQTAKLWDLTKLECRGTLGGMTKDLRHEDVVRVGSLEPELKRAITGASDGTLILWNIETCEVQECFLSGKYGSILSLDVDFKKKKAMTGTAEGTVVIWDAEKLCVREEIAAHEAPCFMARADFAKGGKALTSSKADGRVRVWDLETSTCIGSFIHDSGPSSICHVDWQKRRVLSGSELGEVFLWDLDSCAEIHCFKGHSDRINNFHVDPAFSTGISAGGDDTARIWDLNSRKEMGVLEGHVQAVRDVRADWNNNFIATCSDDTTVRIWDSNTFECKNILEGHLGRVTSLRARFDREMLLSASDDYTVRIWDLENMCEEGVLYGHSGSIRATIAKDVQSE